jgi:hypothetical protein
MKRKKLALGIATTYLVMIATACQGTKEGPPPVKHVKSIAQKRIEKHAKDKHIAAVIAKSNRPYLYAAIASVESDYRPQARGKRGEYGMFQIRADIHGKFDDRMESQLIKCSSILEPLIARYGVEDGVRRYNGRGAAARKYARDVRKREQQIRSTTVDKV